MRGETVTILRRTTSTRDRHGNEVWTYTETDVEGCIVWPTGSTEKTEAQDQASDKITVSCPYGTNVTNVSRMRVRGLLYDVDGTPSPWASPFTSWRPGVEVKGTRVTG